MLNEIQGIPVVDEKIVSELRGRDSEDDSLLQRLFEIYCEECPELIRDLKAARARRDPESCYEAIHQMKGSAASMGAARVFELAKRSIALCENGKILERPEVEEALEREMTAFCGEIEKRLD